jgi:glycosyltransferase involved in cell wall biosynthesis
VAEAGPPELQMLALARSLPAAGVAARVWRPWEDSLADVDCVHLFGSAPEHLTVAQTIRRDGTPVVLSPTAGRGTPEGTFAPRRLSRRVVAMAHHLYRSVSPISLSWRRDLYHSVDLLLPNSNSEARQLMEQFQVAAERIQIVPHAADCRFADADPRPFVQSYGIEDFVLLAGSIEPRNYQLSYLWALRDANLPVVVMGSATAADAWYLAECRRAAGHRVRFVPSLDRDDALRASAYAACGCLVLGGGFETAVQTALEAGMSGTPLVLAEGSCAPEYFGHQAIYVEPDDLPGIRRVVTTALARGRSKELAEHVRAYFSWQAAAKAVRQAYEKLLRKRR